jgi:hypothetical protein
MVLRETVRASATVTVTRVDEEFGLFAARAVPAGQWLFSINGELVATPSRYSVQVDSARHVDLLATHPSEDLLESCYWRFMNHSCDPNAGIRGRAAHSLRAIAKGEEVVFDYNTTEFDLAEKFACRCGSPRCAGRIGGFRYLTRAEQERRRPLLADHLRALLDRPGHGCAPVQAR